MQDYYKILGVSHDATQEQIQQRYHELVKQYHPDKFQNNPLRHLAEEKLKEINIAYESLGKPEHRARYDRQYTNSNSTAREEPDGYRRPSEPEQTHTASGTGARCYKHTDRLAVTTCQFCGKYLCHECASMFTIVSCPDCLSQNNMVYLRKIEKEIKKPLLIFAIITIIGFIASGDLAQSLGCGAYILGIVWGWGKIKTMPWELVGAGMFFGAIWAIALFMILIAFGWVYGLITGGFNYIKLIMHYKETKKMVYDAEQFIKQNKVA